MATGLYGGQRKTARGQAVVGDLATYSIMSSNLFRRGSLSLRLQRTAV